MKKGKRNTGITLVALIITIIVLLILAGVSLSFVFNGGILDKTQSAVNEYEKSSDAEKNILDQIDKALANQLGIPSVDENGLAIEDTTILAKDDPNIQIVIPRGFAPAILNTDRTDSMPGEDGSVKRIMPNEQWNNITKEDINNGIVLVDNIITYDNGQAMGTIPDFNEYVWIPITDNSRFKRVAWAVHNNKQNLVDGVTSTGGFWEDQNTQEYKDMLNSVGLNKGFYISRYEATKKDEQTAESKRNQNPWILINQKNAKTASNNMNTSINSHLIYGIEWDSVIQWLLDSGAKIGTDASPITIEDVISGGSSWGNYSNSIEGAEANSGGSGKPGGINEYWKANNIYNLAGNLWEWTQEKSSTGTSRANRGGAYDNNGENYPVGYRTTLVEEHNYYNLGFRVGFYI